MDEAKKSRKPHTSIFMEHKRGLISFVILLAMLLGLLPPFCREPASLPAAKTSSLQSCRVCYLLNIDGMKGLGHSALLLIDESGAGQLFSYNGMQYNLLECLLGKEGIGKMKVISMNSEETEDFLETGRPPETAFTGGSFEECRDFDRILFRCITEQEYLAILQAADVYIDTGDEFERLYAAACSSEATEQARKEMDAFLSQEGLPSYQIYSHNCDTAAREIIALADPEMAAYNDTQAGLIPGNNYRKMCRFLGNSWGYGALGNDSWLEKLLS